MKHSLVWFRNDLRVSDNPALAKAMQQGGRVSALYIDCPGQWTRHHLGTRKLEFIRLHLDSLEKHLQSAGITLHRIECEYFENVPQLINNFMAKLDVDALYANDEFGFYESRRDQSVSDNAAKPFTLLNDDCIIQPGHVVTKSGTMFKVYTPFRKAWLARLLQDGYTLFDADAKKTLTRNNKTSVNSYHNWGIGEISAQRQLADFCQYKIKNYSRDRDFPALEGGSGLSPYLAIGVLSSRQCLSAIESALGYLPLSPGENGFSWLNELIWREFYRHLMYAFPELSKGYAFKPETRHIQWNKSESRFKLWCTGNTGFPIIDAAMRCLNETGLMHNRLRMIVASFLVKDLHINWQWGERYFMRQLIDADFASNNGGWQWSAGTGADAAPYFRIFNPTTQGQKFDPKAVFIKQWLPELKMVPDKHIHSPHAWFTVQQLQSEYPHPIVDHKVAREKTLVMYKQAGKGE